MYALDGLAADRRVPSRSGQIQRLQQRLSKLQAQVAKLQAALTKANAEHKPRIQAKIDAANLKIHDLQIQIANLQAGVPPPPSTSTTPPGDTVSSTPSDIMLPYFMTQPIDTGGGGAASGTGTGTTTTPPPEPASPPSLFSNPWIIGGAALVIIMLMKR